MIEPAASQSLFTTINRPIVENRSRLSQVRDVENNAVSDRNVRPDSAVQDDSRNSQRVELTRQTEELQPTDRDAPRVRRDDNSDLSFQARQALEQFNQVETETLERQEPVFLGVDLFV